MHLREMAREFNTYEFSKGPAIQGFDPEGVFVTHLKLVGYTNISDIFKPLEVEGSGSPVTMVSTNVINMNEGEYGIRQTPKGESPSKDAT